MRVNIGSGAPALAGPDIPTELVRTLLGFLRSRLGLDTAWLARFRDGMQEFEVLDGDAEAVGLSPSERASLSGSYCVRVIDGRLPAVIPDTSANQTTAVLPITHEWSMGAYVGVPVLGLDGSTVGMVCAVSREAKPHLADVDLRIVRHTADLIGALFSAAALGPDATSEQRKAIRRVVAEQDFEVVFQAVHCVDSGKVLAVEALARFPCEPFRPDVFLRQAAVLGLDIELETAIVKRVFSLMPELPDDLCVSINVSPAAVVRLPWAQVLTDVDPTRVVLEITEHDAVQNYSVLDAALEKCRARGMRIAVDDVGAGFSSFSHILELAPEFVKIDQSITRNIDVDEARLRLAQAIGEFARRTGSRVIAEGVETQGELDAIGAAGITLAQGYHLSRPKPHTHGFPAAAVTAALHDDALRTFDLLGERRFDLALAHSPIGMAVVGLDGMFLRTNRALREMFGFGKRAMAQMSFQEITHPDDLEADLALLAECLEGRRRSYRIAKRFFAADGHIVWCDLTVALVTDSKEQPSCFVSQLVDVTAARIREAELTRQAATDPLTEIANRSAAWSRLEQLHTADNGYGVLFCDIERFKSVNDRRGHHAGDQLLVEVARRLLTAVDGGDLVARWGGDEFLVITDAVTDEELAVTAARITDQFDSTPIPLADGTSVPVALTIGFAGHRPGDGRSIDMMLDAADQAMYEQRRSRTGAKRRRADRVRAFH